MYKHVCIYYMRLSRFAKHLGQDVAAVLVLANDQRETGVVLSAVMLGLNASTAGIYHWKVGMLKKKGSVPHHGTLSPTRAD